MFPFLKQNTSFLKEMYTEINVTKKKKIIGL